MSAIEQRDRPAETPPWREIDVAELDPKLVEAFIEYHTRAKQDALDEFNLLADENKSYSRSDLFTAILANYEASKAAMSRDEGQAVDNPDNNSANSNGASKEVEKED